jgi:hypothetical protein
MHDLRDARPEQQPRRLLTAGRHPALFPIPLGGDLVSGVISRRQALRGGAVAAALSGAGAALAWRGSPASAAPAAGAGPAAVTANPAAIPAGAPLINVGDGSVNWLSGVRNHGTSTTVQGIAFDSVNGYFYTVQLCGASTVSYQENGAQTASATISTDQHASAGDLCVTQHDLTGAIQGTMFLLGFGHGVSIGVQPGTGGAATYLWTEAAAAVSGYGTEVVRFPFADQSVLWTSHPSVQRLPLAQYDGVSTTPSDAATSMTPSVDVTYGILLLRYDINSVKWLAAYRLQDAVSSLTSQQPLPSQPLALLAQPALYTDDANGNPTTTLATFQGFTSFGSYAYLLDGAARTGDPADGLTGADVWAIHTTSMDLNGTLNDPSTGYISRTHSAADADADPREPEGMAIYAGSGAPRLCFSITNNSGSTRQFDLYYKT